MNAQAQEIEVGPVRVDSGNDWFDLGAVILLLVVVALVGRYIWAGKA